mmetsp:Transcript_7787/g.13499  ORF Transcript_7787/g.13499 Transcript_7787/m.13499 type:complete len:84 (+) Transcript_7787:1223-1474(+)
MKRWTVGPGTKMGQALLERMALLSKCMSARHLIFYCLVIQALESRNSCRLRKSLPGEAFERVVSAVPMLDSRVLRFVMGQTLS